MYGVGKQYYRICNKVYTLIFLSKYREKYDTVFIGSPMSEQKLMRLIERNCINTKKLDLSVKEIKYLQRLTEDIAVFPNVNTVGLTFSSDVLKLMDECHAYMKALMAVRPTVELSLCVSNDEIICSHIYDACTKLQLSSSLIN